MRKSLDTVLGWLMSWRSQPSPAGDAQALPEHEHRLRELQNSGRILFLP